MKEKQIIEAANYGSQMVPKEVFKVTQCDQIVGHNVSDSPEQCLVEQIILS